MAARQPVPLPRVQDISIGCNNDCYRTGDIWRGRFYAADCGGKLLFQGGRRLPCMLHPRLKPFYELANHCIVSRLSRFGYILCGRCENFGSNAGVFGESERFKGPDLSNRKRTGMGCGIRSEN